MNLKDLTTSQPLSKRLDKQLKAKGIEVITQFYWSLSGMTHGKRRLMHLANAYLPDSDIPAFLSGELGELLKGHYWDLPDWNYRKNSWQFVKRDRTIEWVKTEAEARGLMLEYLLKNNLIKGK